MCDFLLKQKNVIKLITETINIKYYINKIKCGQPLKHNIEDIVEAILYKCKTGIQWTLLNYKNIHWKVIYNHFNKWTKDDIFNSCWKKILDDYQLKNDYKRNLKHQNIDCTVIKSINGNPDSCIGRNPTDRGRSGTKISIITDMIGVPISYILVPANVHDSKITEETIIKRNLKNNTTAILHADKGYSSKKNIKICKKYKLKLDAPNKKILKFHFSHQQKKILINIDIQ